MKLSTEYFIIEEFWNLNDEEFVQVCDCISSDIRADILVQTMIKAEIEYYEFIYSPTWNNSLIFKCWWDKEKKIENINKAFSELSNNGYDFSRMDH